MGGIFGDLFGSDTKNRRNAFKALVDKLETRKAQEAGRFSDAYDSALADFMGWRDSIAADWSTGFEAAIGQWRSGIDKVTADLDARLGSARATFDVGRASTLEAISQAATATVGRQTARNALTGLGNTSWGAASIDAIRSQEGLQKGMVEEQYSRELAQMDIARADALARLGLTREQGINSLMTQRTTGLAQLSQGFAGGELSARERQAGGVADIGRAYDMAAMEAELGRISQIKSPTWGGALVSALGAGVGGVFGGGMGAQLGGSMADSIFNGGAQGGKGVTSLFGGMFGGGGGG